METRAILLAGGLLTLALGGLVFAGMDVPDPPPQIDANYRFSEFDQGTLRKMFGQGTLVLVRRTETLDLVNVTAGQLVHAPINTVWGTIVDYAHYPEFMPQTEEVKVLADGGDTVLIEQHIGVKIWRLPTVTTEYQLAHRAEPPHRVRFWHVSGDLPGTYGGWDLVESGDDTMIFYTLYSNLTALGLGLGSVMKSQPDFMAAVNTATAMMVTEAIKKESERRANR